MTKDFRNVGRIPAQATEESSAANVRPLQPAHIQRLILTSIYLMAVALIVAGFWLLSGRPSPFPKETSFFMGIGFLVGGIADIFAAMFVKQFWRRRATETTPDNSSH